IYLALLIREVARPEPNIPLQANLGVLQFGYSDVRSSNTPIDKENPWEKDGTGKDVDLHLYRSMIGSLMYLTASRLDIMFAICAYARHQVTPKESYSDSDYGGTTQDRKSTTRGCQFLGRRLSMLCEALSREFSTSILRFNTIMVRLQFYDYHNMVTILEKSEHNIDFHPMVDFIEASPLMYALNVKPIIYVSHIRQFWSTARIETMEEGTQILATVNGIHKTVTESSLRRNLKLRDEE
nr:hypothetical protein [Tanacetum cinerariifolium]